MKQTWFKKMKWYCIPAGIAAIMIIAVLVFNTPAGTNNDQTWHSIPDELHGFLIYSPSLVFW